jgi:hypothetical protein
VISSRRVEYLKVLKVPQVPQVLKVKRVICSESTATSSALYPQGAQGHFKYRWHIILQNKRGSCIV